MTPEKAAYALIRGRHFGSNTLERLAPVRLERLLYLGKQEFLYLDMTNYGDTVDVETD